MAVTSTLRAVFLFFLMRAVAATESPGPLETASGLIHQTSSVEQKPMMTSTWNPQSTITVTSHHHALRPRQSQYIYTGITSYPGSYSYIDQVGSICGYVTNDIHWPVYCGVSQYCNTLGKYIECCTSMTQSPTTVTQSQTITATIRNSYTTTYISTYLNTNENGYKLYGCGGYQACYDSTAASNCKGACNQTALICTDPTWPYCASVYSVTELSDQTTETYAGTSFLCDTAPYGLQWYNNGQWPSKLSTYTTTIIYNSTSTTTPTWTPTIVPFSQTQASVAASAATLPGPTATSAASSRGTLSSSALSLMYTACSVLVYLLMAP